MSLQKKKRSRSNSLPVNNFFRHVEGSPQEDESGKHYYHRTRSLAENVNSLTEAEEESRKVRMLPHVRIENMASSRIVPVVLWGPTPPTHSISSLLVAKDEKCIITGSKEGQLCLWDLVRGNGNEIQIFPCQLLYGHSSAITALADCVNGPDNYALVSATKCGQIFVWDIHDGTCLHSRVIPGHHHAHVEVFQPSGRPDLAPRLLVQGYYSDLFVLDLSSFDILFLLRQKVSPSWVTAMAVVENTTAQTMSFLGLNEDGYMKVWNMKSTDVRSAEPVDNEKQHFVGITSAVSLCTNPYGSAMALVVAQDSWQLFDISEGGFMQLCHVGSDTHSVALTGGAFVDRYQVLVWCSDGTAILYQLTRRCHTQVELKEDGAVGVEPAPPDAPEAAIRLCTFRARSQCPAPQPAFTFFDLSSSGRNQPSRLFLAGNSSGQINAWFLPVRDHVMDLLCKYAQRHMHSPSSPSALLPVPTSALETLEPVTSCLLSDAWTPPAQPLGLVDFVGAKDALKLAAAASSGGDSAKSSGSPPVTASLFLKQQGRVVCGRSDGTIVIVTATHAAAMHLLRATGKWRTGLPHLLLSGHCGAVTALLHPHSVDASRYEADHLISGGEDFTVRLWDVMKGTLIFTLSLHGGVVRHLMCLPPSSAPRLQSCLCSVADDHSVALISLKECRCLLLAAQHIFPVAGIRWRLPDDFLIVACIDGTVYVWEIETGQLDRCVNGSVAVDVLSASKDYHGSGLLDPTGEHSSAAVTGLSSSYQFKAGNTTVPTATTSLSSSLLEISGSLLEVIGLQASRRDPFGHVLLFNCTQLINRLVQEQRHTKPEFVWQSGLLENPKTEAASSAPTSSTASRRRTQQAPATPEQQRPPGPAPGSADYFRRYLGGRRALSAQSGGGGSSSSASSRPTSSASQSDRRTSQQQQPQQPQQQQQQQPPPQQPPGHQSPGLTSKEKSKTKRLIGETISKSKTTSRKDAAQVRAAGMPAQEVAHLMLSLLYTWGVSDLDASASGNLGLVQPARPLSYGLVSRNGCLALLLPGWTFRNRYSSHASAGHERSVASPANAAGWTTVDSDVATTPDAPVERLPAVVPLLKPSLVHWQVSSALSTQHLLCIVAISNTLMTLTQQTVTTPDASSDQDEASEDEDRGNAHMAVIRAGWSQVAALHCVLLHDHLGANYKPPLMTALARRWQDSCIEVRDAAQSLLQSELRRIGSSGRQKLIADWLPFLPHSQASAGVLLRPSGSQSSGSDSRPSTPLTPTPSEGNVTSKSGSGSMSDASMTGVRQGMDAVRLQAVAMVLLALVCSEFTADVTSNRSARGPTTLAARRGSRPGMLASSKSSGATSFSTRSFENYESNVIQMTGKALEYMLLAPATSRYPLNGTTRRTAADLMGRGFNLWAAYVDTPAVIFSLLRLFGTSNRRATSADGGPPVNIVRNSQETRATLRAAHHALSLLALSRPAEFISTIAKEVAMYSPASSAVAQMLAEHRSATALEASAREQSTTAPSLPGPSGGGSGGGVTLGGSGGGVEGDVLRKCHDKIVKILELLLEKMTEDVILQLLEVVDIALHCIDDEKLRQHGLAASFPGLSKFNMVSFCSTTRRLAVGARTGQMAIYDLRSPRCQVVTAHTCPVTALGFSPDGRLLVTYSFGDSKISFWQMTGSLFGMLSSGMRCIKSFPTNPAPPLPVLAQLKTFSLVWVNQRSVILLSNQKEQKFSV